MKRRHRSTIVKRPATVIHATIRLSNGMRTTNNKPLERHKSLPSVTVSRGTSHNRDKSKNPSIVSTIDKNSNKTTNSISINGTEQYSGLLSETQMNATKKIDSTKNAREPSNNKTNSTKQKTKNDQEHTREITPADGQLSSRSVELSHYQDVSNNNMGEKNDNKNMNNIRPDRKDSRNEHHQKDDEKYKRRRTKRLTTYCSCCSHLCAIASLFTGLLFGIAIAAAIVALLTNSKTTTTTVTVDISTTTLTTTTTMTTTTTSLTTSTTVSTTFAVLSIGVNDTINGIWNTTVGGDSTLATPGWGIDNYVSTEPPPNAFDNNCSSKYTSFGACIFNPSWSSPTCGLNTGFYVIPSQGATIMKALRFCTGNDNPQRDPLTMTLEGSNQTGSALMLGSSWNLIYNGSTGLDVDPGRGSLGVKQTFSNNLIAYLSYRILITSKRASDPALQYSEVQLFGS